MKVFCFNNVDCLIDGILDKKIGIKVVSEPMLGNGFLDYVIDLLSPFCQVTVRKMFGAHALYFRGKVFAFVIDHELYFKASDQKATEFFMQAGSTKFSYQKKDGKIGYMCYWKVTPEVLEDRELLEEWFGVAIGKNL